MRNQNLAQIAMSAICVSLSQTKYVITAANALKGMDRTTENLILLNGVKALATLKKPAATILNIYWMNNIKAVQYKNQVIIT